MKASLTLNNKDQIALFYNQPLDIVPEWASVDVEQGEIYIGDSGTGNKTIKLDEIDQKVYNRISHEAEILIIEVDPQNGNKPVKTIFLPLMVSQQI